MSKRAGLPAAPLRTDHPLRVTLPPSRATTVTPYRIAAKERHKVKVCVNGEAKSLMAERL
jgi:hypothetical protein